MAVVKVSGEWFSAKDPKFFDDIMDLAEKRITRLQERLVASEGASFGTPWEQNKPITDYWKERESIPTRTLHGRTGHLLESTRRPSFERTKQKDRFKLDVIIGSDAINEEGENYASLVQEGWGQTVKSWRQRAWMRANLLFGYDLLDPFETEGRNLVGFGEEEFRQIVQDGIDAFIQKSLFDRVKGFFKKFKIFGK